MTNYSYIHALTSALLAYRTCTGNRSLKNVEKNID